MRSHRLLQALLQPADGILSVADVARVGHVPVTGQFHPARPEVEDELMPRRQLRDTRHRSATMRHVSVRQIVENGVLIDGGLSACQGEHGPELGSEEKSDAVPRVVQRLDSQPVTCEQQPLAAFVPDRERIHPRQVTDEVDAGLLVEVHEHLGVRARRKRVPAGLETCAKPLEVVDLPIADDPDRTVLVGHGLVTGETTDR